MLHKSLETVFCYFAHFESLLSVVKEDIEVFILNEFAMMHLVYRLPDPFLGSTTNVSKEVSQPSLE